MSLGDDLSQRLDDVNKQIADISQLIRANEIESLDTVAARDWFEGIVEFAKGIEMKVNKMKGRLADVVSSLETMSVKAHDGHGSEDSAAIAAIRSELKQLWSKLKDCSVASRLKRKTTSWQKSILEARSSYSENCCSRQVTTRRDLHQ